MNVFRNHAVIGFIADDVVVKGTLPKVLIERCGLPALDKMDVLDGRIPFERLHDADNRRGGFHIRPCPFNLDQRVKMIGHHHKITALDRRILADDLPENARRHAGGYGIRPYGSPVRAKQHSALVRAYCDKIGTVLAVIVTAQMMNFPFWQRAFHYTYPCNPFAWRSMFSTMMVFNSPRAAAYSKTFHGVSVW